ncbi:uncharacterized protein LOC129618388, partial [Condylostylus longicornis]|uniref:uncharacterized protein LOC129618388 n=1 Tax=Condylostylus longicornis TaxID=2530218 RepID=UPI00244E3EF1
MFRETISKRPPALSFECLAADSLKPKDGTAVVARDMRLDPFSDALREKHSKFLAKKSSVLGLPIDGKSDNRTFSLLKSIHRYLGLHRTDTAWVLREWIPNVKGVYMMGDFNQWDRHSHPLTKLPVEQFGEDVWSITLEHGSNREEVLRHKMKYKLHIVTHSDQEIDRVPPSASVVWKSEDGNEVYDAAVWHPPKTECHEFQHAAPSRPERPKIYEAYVGFSSHQMRFGTYNEFRTDVLPRIHRLGYNALVLVGVPEHSLTSVGWEVTNFLAPASSFGTPEELKALIDEAHKFGIYVILSIIHSHSSASTAAGLNEIEGGDGGFFKSGTSGTHPQWNCRLFDYSKPEVCRFLMSQLSCFMDLYKIDGFRFEGLTSMLYHHHGVGRDFRDYNDLGRYFSFEVNDEASAYLMLVNDFIHSISPKKNHVLTIGTDHSRMPILAHDLSEGGLGFDYRMAPHIADEWIRQLCHSDDIFIEMSSIVNTLEIRSPLEKTIAASETLANSLRSRRTLKVAMFAWESLHTHAVGGVAPHVTELAAGLARL